MENFINVFGEVVSKCERCGMLFNGAVESCPNCTNDEDIKSVDPERYCREFCQGHKASYDRSVEEGPCFHCDIFE